MGALEEGGKALTGVVDAMKTSPLALALILINLVFIGVVVYVLHEVADVQRTRGTAQDALMQQMVRDCMDMQRRRGDQSLLRLPDLPSIPGITKEIQP